MGIQMLGGRGSRERPIFYGPKTHVGGRPILQALPVKYRNEPRISGRAVTDRAKDEPRKNQEFAHSLTLPPLIKGPLPKLAVPPVRNLLVRGEARHPCGIWATVFSL